MCPPGARPSMSRRNPPKIALVEAGIWRRVNPWRGLAGMPRAIWVLFATTLVNRAGSMVLPFLVLYLTRALGFTPATAGLVVAAYGAAALVAAPVSGRLCDRFGPIRIMRASLLLSGLVQLLFPLARSVPAVFAAAVALALTAEAFRPANMAIVGELVAPDRRKTAFSVNRLAINLGMSIGPALGGFLAAVSFRSIFVVDGLTSLAAGGILVASRFPDRAAAPPAPADGSARPAPGGAMRDPRLLFFLLAGLLPVALVFFQHVSSMPLFLVQDLGMSAAAYGLLFSLNTLLIVLLEVPLNIATSGWTHRRTLSLGALLTAVGFGALGLARGPAGVAATVVVWTFGEMFFFPGMAAYVSDIAPQERRGAYMGMAQMGMALAFTIGPWAGNAVLERAGGRVVWGATFVLGLAAAAALARLPEPDGSKAGSG